MIANIFKCDFCKETERLYPMSEGHILRKYGTISIKYDPPNSDTIDRTFDICGKCISEIIDKTKG